MEGGYTMESPTQSEDVSPSMTNNNHTPEVWSQIVLQTRGGLGGVLLTGTSQWLVKSNKLKDKIHLL